MFNCFWKNPFLNETDLKQVPNCVFGMKIQISSKIKTASGFRGVRVVCWRCSRLWPIRGVFLPLLWWLLGFTPATIAAFNRSLKERPKSEQKMDWEVPGPNGSKARGSFISSAPCDHPKHGSGYQTLIMMFSRRWHHPDTRKPAQCCRPSPVQPVPSYIQS